MGNAPWDDDQAAHYAAENAPTGTADAVRYLSVFAAGSDMLEFGVGTGRLAIPLAASFRRIVGVDISPSMLAMAARDGLPSNVHLVQGDAASWSTEQRFNVVLCAFNFLLQFTSQELQLAVIRNAATHLSPGGHLIVENMHPPLRALEEGERIATLNLPGMDMVIMTQRLDWRSFLVDQRTLYVKGGTVRTRQLTLRMLLPSEQDLMAHIADLHLVKRMGSWRGTPWRLSIDRRGMANVISIYQKGSAPP